MVIKLSSKILDPAVVSALPIARTVAVREFRVGIEQAAPGLPETQVEELRSETCPILLQARSQPSNLTGKERVALDLRQTKAMPMEKLPEIRLRTLNRVALLKKSGLSGET